MLLRRVIFYSHHTCSVYHLATPMGFKVIPEF